MIPNVGVFIAGFLTFLVVAWDSFEAIILPRRVTRKFRLARFYFRTTWASWKAAAKLISSRKRKETFLGFYGPLSLLVLIGVWAIGLVISFGMMQYGAGSAINLTSEKNPSFYSDLYLSGTTFFTLGLGDVVPRAPLARFLVVVEAGFGFGFLAAIIGYLPFIYSAFGARETNITLLDARAGTPPTAGELLRRHSYPQGDVALAKLLENWERWSADLLESHLSYPVLAYFRSQHDNQSWISSLTAILDTCALTVAGIEGACAKQAELTFAISRHAIVDLAQIFAASPRELPQDRLSDEDLLRIRNTLAAHGMNLVRTPEADRKLKETRAMYEPYVYALANHLNQTLPPWIPTQKAKDNWQTTAWAQTAGMIEREIALIHDDHF
jgi:Ion channel